MSSRAIWNPRPSISLASHFLHAAVLVAVFVVTVPAK